MILTEDTNIEASGDEALLNRKAIILFGSPGSGKSDCISTILKNNSKNRIIYLATEYNALAGVRSGLIRNKIDFNPNQFIYSILTGSDKAKQSLDTEIKALTEFAKASVSATMQTDKTSNANKIKYTFLIDVMTKLQSFVGTDILTKDKVNIGNIGDLDYNDILVIDGLTPIIRGIWAILQGDRKANVMNDYQVVQKQLDVVIDLILKSTKSHVIFLAHADHVYNDQNVLLNIQVLLNAGRAIRDTFLGNFTDVIYCYRNPVGKFIWATKKNLVITVARNLPEKDMLDPDFSLYNLF